jgi:hypothetical protein
VNGTTLVTMPDGRTVELHMQAASLSPLPDDFMPVPRMTRQQYKTWLRLAGLPSGRREKRRARKRRGH